MLNTYVSNILRDCGIPASLCGYRYLRTAICMVVEDPKNIDQVTKCLYPAVAKTHGETPVRVERGMRHAIETAFERNCDAAIRHYIGNCVNDKSGKVTITEFVGGIADYIRLHGAPSLLVSHRPCSVCGAEHLFHGWLHEPGSSTISALVEDATGNMHIVNYSDLTFTDCLNKARG